MYEIPSSPRRRSIVRRVRLDAKPRRAIRCRRPGVATLSPLLVHCQGQREGKGGHRVFRRRKDPAEDKKDTPFFFI